MLVKSPQVSPSLKITYLSTVCQLPRSKATSISEVIHTYASLTSDYTFASGHLPTKNLFYPHSALQLLGKLSSEENHSPQPATNVLTMSKRWFLRWHVTSCQGNLSLHILLLNFSFDDLLDGGFPCGRITEVCGQPGVGKTQFW